jgi:glycosyltransferase involved in cell wall biosynthesis
MIPLSVVVITYNEENAIGTCLESVKNIADEIVIVDSYSTDRTKEICEQYHARFYSHPFEGHIQQKNLALQKATHPYVLSLDADEALSETLKRQIEAVKKNWEYDGYYFNRLTNYCGKWIRHGGWYPDKKLRLIDKRKGEWTGVNPHDKLELSNASTSCFLKGDLLHYSYHSIRGHIKQVNTFTDLGATSAYKAGKKATLCQLLLNPFWKFIRDFFFRFGFLDGYYGFVIAMISAHATFIKYVKLKELRKQ